MNKEQIQLIIQEKLQSVQTAVKELQVAVTEIIEGHEWRTEEYIANNIVAVEELEIEVLAAIRKLDKIAI